MSKGRVCHIRHLIKIKYPMQKKIDENSINFGVRMLVCLWTNKLHSFLCHVNCKIIDNKQIMGLHYPVPQCPLFYLHHIKWSWSQLACTTLPICYEQFNKCSDSLFEMFWFKIPLWFMGIECEQYCSEDFVS